MGDNVREVELRPGLELAIHQDSELENDAGVVVWDSALVLIHYLAKLRHQEQQRGPERDRGGSSGGGGEANGASEANVGLPAGPPPRVRVGGARVLELGAGTGAVGLAAAALGAARVLLTDRPHLLPLMRQNIEANGLGAVASAAPYEWGAPLPLEIAAPQGGRPAWDLVILSDLVYDPEALQPLVATLAALLEGSDVNSGAAGGATGGGGGGAAAAQVAEVANGGGGGGGDGDAAAPAASAAVAGAPAAAAGAPAVAASAAAAVAGAPAASPAVLVAVELRTDTGVAQFVRLLVQRGYYVERVPAEELSEEWRDDDIWVFVVKRRRA